MWLCKFCLCQDHLPHGTSNGSLLSETPSPESLLLMSHVWTVILHGRETNRQRPVLHGDSAMMKKEGRKVFSLLAWEVPRLCWCHPDFMGESLETAGLKGLHSSSYLIISCGQTPTQKVIGELLAGCTRLIFVGVSAGTTHEVRPKAPRLCPGLTSGLSATCASNCCRSPCGKPRHLTSN